MILHCDFKHLCIYNEKNVWYDTKGIGNVPGRLSF